MGREKYFEAKEFENVKDLIYDAVKKYNEKNYDEVKVRVKKGSKDIIQRHANSNNETVNGMINRLLENEIPELKD